MSDILFNLSGKIDQQLGRDMALMADPVTKDAVRRILEKETGQVSEFRLVTAMLRNRFDLDSEFDDILILVEKLKQGFTEISKA